MHRIRIIESMDTPALAAAPVPIFDPDKVYEAPWPTDMIEKSGNVEVYYQRAMKNDATLAVCRALSLTSELHYKRLMGYFKGRIPEATKLVVASLSPHHDGMGGGYHLTAAGSTCFCDVKLDTTRKRYDPAFTSFIFCAEVTQPFAYYNTIGWSDDYDNGEGLSRVMAITLMPGQLGPYGVVVKWLNNGRPDWTKQITGQYLGRSIGCAMAYLFWARNKKKIPWEVLIGAGKNMPNCTLEDMWRKLGQPAGLYGQMMKDIDKAYPPGKTLEDTEANEVIFAH